MDQKTVKCQSCKNDLVIEPEDFDFYKKIDVPPPTWCPECRLIRRLAARNERGLYKRACDSCNELKIMMYPEDTKYTVYCRDCWISDQWGAEEYALEYDSKKPFFQQFDKLLKSVPRVGIIKQGHNINSEYTNRVTDQKNCYLVFATTPAENCYYGVWINGSKECVDCFSTQQSEMCYECIDCIKCYKTKYSQECQECRNSEFLWNCKIVKVALGVSI